MISEYVRAAMHQAKYELLEDGEGFYGHIPACPGVWSNAQTLEICREELQEVLEDWLLIGIWHHDSIPLIDGIDLNLKQQEVA
jgi:predicted RNase H-like HicB family nuclease